MNVLSLFDGMSCGQIALNRLGIKYDNYYASEIDKYAIKVTMENYPNTIQLGSVTDIDTSTLPKIDLLIGGSPCQSFSFAGKRKGMATKSNVEIHTLSQYLQLKSEGYEFEGQSYLFWEYVRIMQEVKPKYFLLENVRMEEKWEKLLSRTVGVNPIMINSSLVSAQSRERLYWTNIGMIPAGLFGHLESAIKQPKDKKLLLKDILQDNPDAVYYLSDKMLEYFNRRGANFNNGKINYKFGEDKASTITASSRSIDISDNIIVDEKYFMTPDQKDRLLNRIKVDIDSVDETTPLDVYNKRIKKDGKTPTLLDPKHNSLKLIVPIDEKYYVKNFTENQKNKFEKLNPNTDKSGCLTEAIARGGSSDEYISMLKRNSILSNENNPLPVDEKYYLSEKMLEKAVITNESKNIIGHSGTGGQKGVIHNINGQSSSLCSTDYKQPKQIVESGTFRTHKDGNGFRQVKSGKGATLPARARQDGSGQNVVSINNRIRRLTPIECERLQTVPDNYTNHVSDTQRYKMLGNGWTIDVIAHIFSYAKF
jgi:DNA (cytosine-5)-methyltransferase 3A